MKYLTLEKIADPPVSDPAEIDRIAAAIVEEMKFNNHVSFAELENKIEGFGGNWAFEIPERGIVFWFVSHAAADALNRLKAAGVFHFAPTVFLVYMADGRCLDLPIAKKVGPYKQPHWAPVTLVRGSVPLRGNAHGKMKAP